MTAQSALAFPFMDKVCQMHFTNIDALRRTQGEALGMLGFGPNECDYHVILSGPHWCLRKYAHHDAQLSLLIVPAPIKRPYIWDLAPSISVVRHCLDRHFGVYLLEWMPPLASGKQAGLADYADHAISECVAKVSHESQGSRPFLMGHSLGGTLAAIFCALEQESVRGLVLLGAPLCFASGSSRFRDALASLFPRTLAEAEIVPGSLLSQVSALASPDAFVWARLRDGVLSIADPTAMEVHVRVERWALDEVPLPGPLVSEIVQLLYRENRFCRGTLTIRDRSLGPSSVRVPILAIVNTADEVAPLNSVKHFLDEMPMKETRIIEYPGEAGIGLQHLALLAGPQAHARIWPAIFSWLDMCDTKRAAATRGPKAPVSVPGWEHFAHDADIGLCGWGATVAEAFEQAGQALTAAVTDAAIVPRTSVEVHCEAPDIELLFVEWLNAIIYEMAVQQLLFGGFTVRIDGRRLQGTLWGEPVDVERHAPACEPKGATYTALKVARSPEGLWSARCVVDV